jgi:predicted thioredoxin/glutaredoxin
MPNPVRHTIEVFSAGCSACNEGLRVVREIAGAHEVKVQDMRDKSVEARARRLGIHRVPAVVVDGKVAQCCNQEPVDPDVIRELLGSASA